MGISLLVFVPKIQSMLDKVIGTSIDRLNMIFNEGSQLDSSAAAHFNYYSNLPDFNSPDEQWAIILRTWN